MNLAIINSRADSGIDAPPVSVEVHITNGMPSLSIVGLPETAVKESKDRVRSAIINSGFEFPVRRITISLAPADLPKKNGGRYDLPIALGILLASKQLVASDLDCYEFAGELALDGSLRSFSGILPLALATKTSRRALVIPRGGAFEAGLIRDITVFAPTHLLEIVAHLTGNKKLSPMIGEAVAQRRSHLDLSDIRGQNHAKRALEIVAVGGHSLFMIGPPGVGKTMIASRLISILPEMSDEEALESAAIYSVCGKNIMETWRQRPFRAPHHSASSVALVGGSSPPRPGEISLAHHGVLFMDELLEFNRSVLESLREPLESRYIIISRAAQQTKFPAKFQLVTAMNPCPCGYFGDTNGRCSCSPEQVRRYRARLSGPFLDRLDVWIKLPTLSGEVLFSSESQGDSSAIVRSRIIEARSYAMERRGKINCDLNSEEITRFCKISTGEQQFLVKAIDKLKLSARSYHKILKIARTIADLEKREQIQSGHLREAIMYRRGI